MTDNFQSKPVLKAPRAAKTVEVKSGKNSADVISTASINEAGASIHPRVEEIESHAAVR